MTTYAEPRFIQGDITLMGGDAIVNAANTDLLEGGGVCGAIFSRVREAGGHAQLTAACRAIKHCTTGEAVITPSFGLDAPHIIHAVGPKWSGERHVIPRVLTPTHITQLRELASTYRAILRVCRDHVISSVSIPSISTGIFGLPQELGAAIANRICSEESIGIAVTLVAFNGRAMEALQAAPTPAAAALLHGISL
jgi:O-acetyl-ADP-ribose deacetylase